MDDDLQPLPLNMRQDALDAPTLASLSSAERAEEVAFLIPSPSTAHLADSAIYRPGAIVAGPLLAGPVICAIAGAIAVSMTGVTPPVWLPLALLLWLPALALAWALLKSVRVTPDALACGRPLGRWHVAPFHEIERVEQQGMRLIVTARSGPPLTFTPRLLHRGAQLRRSLLLRLPLSALSSQLRAEAQTLEIGDLVESASGDVEGVLSVRPQLRWTLLAGALALALLVAAVLAFVLLTAPVSLALTVAGVALAGVSAYTGAWMAQDIFVSEKGLIVRYTLLRRERDIFWTQVRSIEYLPGEAALVLRSVRSVTCAGPGLLTTRQARLMRGYISRYCVAQVMPTLPRRTRA